MLQLEIDAVRLLRHFELRVKQTILEMEGVQTYLATNYLISDDDIGMREIRSMRTRAMIDLHLIGLIGTDLKSRRRPCMIALTGL